MINHTCGQQSFVENPMLSQQLFELLDIVFPDLGLSQIAQAVRALGTSWEAVSTPFMCFEEGKAIAHVGVLELPLWIAGTPVTVGGIHGVCTHPNYRQRGYYRQCMTAALEYCRDRYQTLILTTGQPELYEPFGFRVMPEHAFIASCNSQSTHNGFRVLNLQAADDQQILHRLLQDRHPVSQILGVLSEETVFLFNEIYNPLYYAEDLDLIAVMAIENAQLKLHDVVWKQPCSFTDILDRIPYSIKQAIIYFSPDRLKVQAQAIPQLQGGDSYLMVQGQFDCAGKPLMLPRPSRC